MKFTHFIIILFLFFICCGCGRKSLPLATVVKHDSTSVVIRPGVHIDTTVTLHKIDTLVITKNNVTTTVYRDNDNFRAVTTTPVDTMFYYRVQSQLNQTIETANKDHKKWWESFENMIKWGVIGLIIFIVFIVIIGIILYVKNIIRL